MQVDMRSICAGRIHLGQRTFSADQSTFLTQPAQALDMGVDTLCSSVYPGHLRDTVLW